MQIARALEFLHSNHIIYRDLKAENVLVWRFPLPRQLKAFNSVLVKLADYGISRFSYPSDVCKGYGGTEGFMAPEILRYNGEFEYTEKVDCYSFGMFMYELVSLRHPYDGQEQMKDCIFEGQRPFLAEKDILCPSNALDLMVSCWAEDAAERPSSSELVAITSAPEFTHMSDVALLRDEELPAVAAVVSVPADSEAGGRDSEPTSQCWVTRPDGACTVLSFNQHGWLESEVLGPLRSAQVTAVAQVGRQVWLGNAAGEVTVYSCAPAYAELASFQVQSLDPQLASAAHLASTVRAIGSYPERGALLIALPQTVILCATNGGALPHFLASVSCDEVVHTAVLVPSAADW